jgi:protein-disulfide isomerase
MNEPAVDALLRHNYRLAEQLGVTGTPSFLVNRALVGSFDREALSLALRDAEGA